MARRYSGNYRVSVLFEDSSGLYRCRISHASKPGHRASNVVAPPAALEDAVDCPAAYDRAARASLAFAIHDNQIDDADVDYSTSGIAVSRKPLAQSTKAAI